MTRNFIILISAFAVLTAAAAERACAQQNASQRSPQRRIHYFHSANMPPGSVGQGQLARDPRLLGHVQPVQLSGPAGVHLSVAVDGSFAEPQPSPLLVGLQIGHVYQFKVTQIEFAEGQEVFPTIELVQRLYPPPGKELRFPVPVVITHEELEMALRGLYIVRVIYLEDSAAALPARQPRGEQNNFDVRGDEDPLRVADELGKPIAILRMGSRVPTDENQLAARPPVAIYPQHEVVPPPAREQIEGAILREQQNFPRLPLPGESPRSGPFPGGIRNR